MASGAPLLARAGGIGIGQAWLAGDGHPAPAQRHQRQASSVIMTRMTHDGVHELQCYKLRSDGATQHARARGRDIFIKRFFP